MNPLTIALIYGLTMTGLIVIEAVFADRSGMLFPAQMFMLGRNYRTYMPFIGHGGMWGDLIILTPLTTLIIAGYSGGWLFKVFLFKLFYSVITTAVLHHYWAQSKSPDCLAWNGRATLAGMVHMYYMVFSLTVVLMLYFGTNHIEHAFLVLSSTLLMIHIFIGTHKVLDVAGSLHVPFRWWNRKLSDDKTGNIVVLVLWLALWVRTAILLRS